MKKLIFFIFYTYLFSINIPQYFHSNFVQTITSKHTLLYKGELYFSNNKVLWHYTYPEEKYILINKNVLIYEPDLMQVEIRKRANISLKDILKNAKKVKKNLYKAKLNNKLIYFEFNKTLKQIYYTDEVGNRVKIDFINPSLKKFSENSFNLKIPSDVDYIKE